MHKLKPVIFFATIILIAVFSYPAYLKFGSSGGSGIIASPLPDLLTKSFVSSFFYDHWKPNTNLEKISEIKEPEITAAGAISYDLKDDKLLYAKNMETRLPMASLTKIMTAVIALENMDLTKELKVGKEASEIGENSMGLSEGEILSLEELLYGLILHSGNDAAETIARSSLFGRNNFVYLMNKKAEDLGLTNTRFTNPSGLEGDGQQYSTVYDLLVMTRYALKNLTFAKVVSTVEYEIPYTKDHKYIYLFNETNLLTSYPGVKGVKTGYTLEAGLCLVTYLEYEGRKIIAVLLNSQSRREEMKELLDYSLRTLGINPPPHP